MAGLDTIPGQKGFLVINAEGAVLQSSGDLKNDEHTAAMVLSMIQSCGKLMSALNGDRKGAFHRLSIVYRHHTLVASVWRQCIHVVKRVNKET